MALPNIIEFMTSLERPQSGGQICNQAQRQDIVSGLPVLAAGESRLTQMAPPKGIFAMIVYRYAFGRIVPDVFSYSLNHTGSFVANGILTADVLADGIDFFMVVTNRYQSRLLVTNRDVVAQLWQASLYYLSVTTVDDMRDLARALISREYSAHAAYLLRAVQGGWLSEPLSREDQYGVETVVPIYGG